MQNSLQILEKLEALSIENCDTEEFKTLLTLLKLSLIEQQSKFEIFSNTIREGFAQCEIVYDSKGKPNDYKVLRINEAFPFHTGMEKEMIVGKRILEVYPEMDKKWLDFYGEVVLAKKPNSMTGFDHNTKRHYVTTAYSNGQDQFVMLFRDITEEKDLEIAQIEIKKQKEEKNYLLNNMLEGFKHCEILLDEDNLPYDFKILEVNKAYETQTGLKREEIIGKTMLQIFPDIEKSWIETLCNVATTGKSKNFIDFNHNTGKYYDISAFSPTYGEFALFVRDCTERENERLKLEKAYKKAEESDNLKSAFLANMSHDIRTPMNAILGCSELLGNENLDKEEHKKCLQHIKSSGNRLLSLISDIVDISKIDSQQQKLIFDVHNLNHLMYDIRDQFTLANSDKKIILTLEVALEDNNSCIKTDDKRLNQILSNLLENAFKFTEEGEITFGYSIKDGFLEFFVKDTGIGIKPENQSIIFKRFGQINNSAAKNDSGSGLGMSIVKGLIALFEGEIWLYSELNQGSEFFFKIPYIPYKNEDKKRPKDIKILVAEDEEINFYLLNIWLKDLGTVLHAKNGQEALDLFYANPDIEIIVMDIRMPILNGLEVTKEIRKSNTTIPIIAHTAYAMNDEAQSIKEAGCTDILIKPAKQKDLICVLEKHSKALNLRNLISNTSN
ncbi:ATP-binding protein [Maribacter sp. CXY002]|uniref:PAS domain-containing hybrid sensor histidine kinase/response regulator n=1 Tax=Maribacter luteocoastalis TaxID=3407671 RepID=UPI003B6773E2